MTQQTSKRHPYRNNMLILNGNETEVDTASPEDEPSETKLSFDEAVEARSNAISHEFEAVAGLLIEKLDTFKEALSSEEHIARLPRLLVARRREQTLVHGEVVEGVAFEQNPDDSTSKLVLSKPLPAGSSEIYIITWLQADESKGRSVDGHLSITSVKSREEMSLRRNGAISGPDSSLSKNFQYDESDGRTNGKWPVKPINAKDLMSPEKSEKLLESATSSHMPLFNTRTIHNKDVAIVKFEKLLIDEVWQLLDETERQAIEKKLIRDEPLTPEQQAMISHPEHNEYY